MNWDTSIYDYLYRNKIEINEIIKNMSSIKNNTSILMDKLTSLENQNICSENTIKEKLLRLSDSEKEEFNQ